MTLSEMLDLLPVIDLERRRKQHPLKPGRVMACETVARRIGVSHRIVLQDEAKVLERLKGNRVMRELRGGGERRSGNVGTDL
jgi:hypothetical protein